jgi:hypothetical protein
MCLFYAKSKNLGLSSYNGSSQLGGEGEIEAIDGNSPQGTPIPNPPDTSQKICKDTC